MRNLIIHLDCGETIVLSDSEVKIDDRLKVDVLPIRPELAETLFAIFPAKSYQLIFSKDILEEMTHYIKGNGCSAALNRIRVMIDKADDFNFIPITYSDITFVSELIIPKPIDIPKGMSSEQLGKYIANAVSKGEMNLSDGIHASLNYIVDKVITEHEDEIVLKDVLKDKDINLSDEK